MNQKIKDEVFKYLKIFELPVDEQIDLDVLSSKYNDFCKKYDPSLTDSPAYKDGEKFREIKESYFFLKTKIDYVNKIIEAEKGEKENAIGNQNKSAQKSDDKPNKYSSDSQNDEALERAKDLVLARLLNKINNTGKDEYSKKNYESIKEKIEAFEKQINSYTDKKNLEKDYSSLVKEIEKIPTVETERIKKLKFTSIVGGIVAVAVVVLIFVVSIVRGIPIKQVNQAKELLINGDYATAEQLLETAGTERAQLLLQQIDVYKNLNEGNYDEAHSLFIPFGNVQIEYITGDGYVVYTDFVEGMKNTYYVSAKPDYDFMGYTFRTIDDLSFHHIEKKSDGGLKTIDNGALLTKDLAHPYLHLIEDREFDMYVYINNILREINSQHSQPTYAQLKAVREVLLEFERRHYHDRNSHGEYLIKQKYIDRRIKL